MRFENTTVHNFDGAFRGMRNPKESWGKSDSCFGIDCNDENVIARIPDGNCFVKLEQDGDYFVFASIGKNDMALAQSLIKAGGEHRKFLRQILVSVDITASLFWWKEFDTYKVGTVANSTSTMHKIHSKPITLDCFEVDDLCNIFFDDEPNNDLGFGGDVEYFIQRLEKLRLGYLSYIKRSKSKDITESERKHFQRIAKRYWKELIRWLPESWLQTRTVTMNYENLLGMCSKGQRRFHELNEWSGKENSEVPNFISWARTLPYAQDFIFIDEEVE